LFIHCNIKSPDFQFLTYIKMPGFLFFFYWFFYCYFY
jgi:hypothetical protein